MSTAADPKTFEIEFQPDGDDPKSFMAYQAKGIPGWRLRRNRSSQQGSPLPGESLPIDMTDLSAGAGHSQRWTPNVYDYAYPGDGRDPRGFVPPSKLEMIPLPQAGLTGTFTCAFELDNVAPSVPPDLYILGDHYAFRWQTGSSNLTISAFFSALFTPLSCARYNGPVYVAGEGGLNIWRAPTNPSDVWTQSSDFAARHIVPVSMVFGAGFGGEGDYENALIADIDGSTIKWTTGDPMFAVNWKPVDGLSIGQSHHVIKAIIAATEAFAVVKPDGVWKIDGEGHARNLAPFMERDTDVNAPMCGQFDGADLFVSHPRRYHLVPFTNVRQESPVDATPGAWPVPSENPLTGQITANTELGTGEKVAAMHNPTLDESSIWLGRMRAETGVDGVGPVLWQGAYQIIPGGTSMLHVTSLAPVGDNPEPWLWFGSTASQTFTWHGTEYPAGMYAFRCRVARGQAPLRDPSYPFATSFWKSSGDEDDYAARIFYSMNDGGAQLTNVPKSSYEIEASVGGDPATSFLTVATKADDGDFVVQGQLAAPRGFLAETQQDGMAFQHRVDLRGGTEERPTIIRGITPHLQLRPEQRREYEFWVRCGPTVETNSGSIGSLDADIAMAWLEHLQMLHDVTVKIGKRVLRGKVMPGISGEDVSVLNGDGLQRVVQGVFCESSSVLTWGDGHEWGKFP